MDATSALNASRAEASQWALLDLRGLAGVFGRRLARFRHHNCGPLAVRSV